MNDQIKVLNKLDEMNIKYEVVEHIAINVDPEVESFGTDFKGANIVKNLFLKNAKGKEHFLVIMDKEKELNLKELKVQINSSVLSNASMIRLEKFLKLKNGVVSPFGVFNDEKKRVKVLIDSDLDKDQIIGVNINNTPATVLLLLNDLIALIEANGNTIRYITINEITLEDTITTEPSNNDDATVIDISL
jgi:Ala-tRNA(Pro) deacylase